jgi:citrate synthase
MKEQLHDWTDEEEVADYVRALLKHEAFDRKGLVYGMGHAVYTLSDPRARLLKKFVQELSVEKGLEKEFALYELVERIAPPIIQQEKNIIKPVCANVDFYSGFAYQMLGLPMELYTPIFAIARIAGWSAHRLEEISLNNKIMRPAYMTVKEHETYKPLEDR